MAKVKSEEHIGKKFGKLKILSVTSMEHKGGVKRTHFNCLCDCGQITNPLCFSVLGGRTTSCGCHLKEVRGKSRCLKAYEEGEEMFTAQPIYTVWQNMKARCLRKSHPSYENYGGRGIDFPEHWKNFLGFYEDMGEDYKEGLELDRIDNNKGYSKENCRWTTNKINSWNTRGRRGAKSKYKGVGWQKKKNENWTATIRHNGVKYHIGCFDTELEAARAYDEKCIELRGEYAYTNQQQFPEDFI